MKRVVRKLFPRLVSRYRRLTYLLANKPKIIFSHSGEDILIQYIISDPSKSLRFVDIGCSHPIIDNNTFSMYRKGHYGVNVDARSELKKPCSLIRPRDRFITSLVSEASNSNSANFFVNSDDPHVSSISEDWATGHLDSRMKLSARSVSLSTLADIFRSNYEFLGLDSPEKRSETIFVLSVDVEGHDLSVLKSNDWTLFKPNIVCVETLGPGSIESLIQGDIYQLLSGVGYQLVALTPLTSLFELNPSGS